MIAACNPTTPTIRAPLTATPTPYPTVPRATSTPVPTPTLALSPTSTSTTTARPTATLVPTRQPNETFWAEVDKYGLTSASTVGPKGEIYTFDLVTSHEWYPGTCRLYVGRWDGLTHTTIWEHDGASDCEAINWDALSTTADERQTLQLNGYWSDINHNGLPEFTVWQGSGCGGCDEANIGHTAIYEIYPSGDVLDIMEGLPAELIQFPDLVPLNSALPIHVNRILHSTDPVTVYMTDFTYYELHSYVKIAWIYQWDGDKYVNVSTQYADEYRQQIKQIVADLKMSYGKQFDAGHMFAHHEEEVLKILLLGNAVQLPQKETLDAFLEATNPSHWLLSDNITKCWLQVARASAQIDYGLGVPYRLTGFPHDMVGTDPQWLYHWAEQIDVTRFDVSACK